MKLPVARIGAVIAQWIDTELLPKAVGWQKVATIMVALGIVRRADSFLVPYMPLLIALGYADTDNNIDIDAVYDAAKEAFSKTGKITIAGGVIIGPDDIDQLLAIAKASGV